MLDGIRQALDLVRDFDRLDVLVATLTSAHGGDVDRPSVGEIEDRVGDRQTADLPTALPVLHRLFQTSVVDVIAGQWEFVGSGANSICNSCEHEYLPRYPCGALFMIWVGVRYSLDYQRREVREWLKRRS